MPSSYTRWRKSTYSAPNSDCIEVGNSPTDMICVRDSKAGDDGPILEFTSQEWTAFLKKIDTARCGR